MTESFVIPYPKTDAGKKLWSREYGLNAYYAGKHWAKRRADADMWHRLVAYEMERQKVRRTPMKNAVILTFYWNDRPLQSCGNGEDDRGRDEGTHHQGRQPPLCARHRALFP